MQVHVKTPHIDIQIRGEEYKSLIDLLKKEHAVNISQAFKLFLREILKSKEVKHA